ncbi:hypothetical protein ACFW2K_38225 [Streptomyces nigra]
MHISEMFRLVRSTGHILDVLDVLAMDLTDRPRASAGCCPP